MQVRLLAAADAAAYQRVRLRSLQEHPEAFGASYEEEADTPLEKIAQSLDASLPNNPIFGAFIGEELVGITALNRYTRRKTRHRAIVGGVYVTREVRGQGAAGALMDALVGYAATLDGVEEIILAVTVGNETARRLYLKMGFTPYSIEPRYFKIGGQYYDLEWMSLTLDKGRG